MVAKRLAGATLTIDLGAIAANWKTLARLAAPAECAAVVKADAYGTGLRQAAGALWDAGCRSFFVAHVAEGIALRRHLGRARIFVLNGPPPGTEGDFHAHRLLPVLNTRDQVAGWAATGRGRRKAAIHLDTGMSRLGLGKREIDQLLANRDLLDRLDVVCWMSHLACAEERDHPLNRTQLRRFRRLLERLPPAPASLANSSGVFLGKSYRFDMVRPGVALFGANPTPGKPNPMAEVVRLRGRIVQVRDVDSPMTVGYGATHRITRPGRIATVPVGYADGYLRSLGNQAFGYIGDVRVPVVGRVSMDLITFDISALAPEDCRPGTYVDLIGGPASIDAVAAAGGTIAYELLTSLGRRYHRAYVNKSGK